MIFYDLKWPLQLFLRARLRVNYKDSEYGEDVLFEDVEQNYFVAFEPIYYYLVNWDTENMESVQLDIMVTRGPDGARYLSTLASTATVFLSLLMISL